MSKWQYNIEDDISDRLLELNNWQLEQQQKIREYQEAQRRLLDSEHQKLLSTLTTQNFNGKSSTNGDYDPDTGVPKKPVSQFQIKSIPIRLENPKTNLFSFRSNSPTREDNDFHNGDVASDLADPSRPPKKFLRRGDGLSRFRMTLEDFKSPPSIYRENKIKTYLKEKPEFKIQTRPRTGSYKSVINPPKKKVNPQMRRPARTMSVPVNIYVNDNKHRRVNSARSGGESHRSLPQCESRPRSMPIPKSPMKNLVLKQNVATEWYNVMKENEKKGNKCPTETNAFTMDLPKIKDDDIDVNKQIKRDEKELKIFEMLEEKVDDSSFCSNSSYVNKLLGDSLSSTPMKSPLREDPEEEDIEEENNRLQTYMNNLKALQKQYLNDDQLEKLKDLDAVHVLPYGTDHTSAISETDRAIRDQDGETVGELEINASDSEKVEVIKNQEVEKASVYSSDIPGKPETSVRPSSKASTNREKYILQDYINNFKNLKTIITENMILSEDEEEEDEEEEGTLNTTANEESPKKTDLRHLNKNEIALKVQRKALQDNVKNLLNWEGSARKKQPKKLIKKPKVKQVRVDKPKKVDKNKIICDGALLKERLDELEKEIDIFRKENRKLTKLQKDYEDDRLKLRDERKEFEKYMKEEKEKFEIKVTEEHKKLQRDKNVFEKYCKQIKNQPTKQEREEIANLKKELEKLNEVLSTKESRWGSSQARLRNQLKSLEKENTQLKSEIEKYKKQSIKKVTFENGKNLNTKIIHAINSELGKLRTNVIKNNSEPTTRKKYQSVSARVPVQEKPIRRINSVPDMKESVDNGSDFDYVEEIGLSNRLGEKVLRSVSVDSGVETNESRYTDSRRSNDLDAILPAEGAKSATKFAQEEVVNYSQNGQTSNPPVKVCWNGEKIQVNGQIKKNTDNSGSSKEVASDSLAEVSKDQIKNKTDEAVYGAVFGSDEYRHTNSKILEIKRRLGRLNLLDNLDSGSEDDEPWRKTDSIPNRQKIRSSKSSFESSEESEQEHNTAGKNKPEEKPFQHITENTITPNGVRERHYDDGRREIIYPNGNVKKISPGGEIIKVIYYNGDLKETNNVEGSEKYYYATTKTWHTTYKDGLEVLEFPNGQTERRRADGSTEICFPNGCVRYCDATGKEELRFVDGTVVKTDKNGHKMLIMPNGQKEIHTKDCKRREYPDGTVKLLYPDGTQETRYANGRVRLKDKDGNLVMDSGGIR